MWNLKSEFEARAKALDNARRVHAETAEFCRRLRAEAGAEARSVTLTGVAPQAGGPRAWAPLMAAGLAPRPDGRRSRIER